ncbi:MAG: LamG-like jellyroll fold domain-containing protein [Candidatus Paceibacterota bacterium]|jgi:prepilin-type N-terminal cleavage/methylation domain-containing protein
MKNRAFTLIELLVVIAIVGILSSVIYTNITGLRDRARVTAGIRFDSSTLHSIGDQLVGEWLFDSPNNLLDTSGFNNVTTCTVCPTYATTSGYNNKGTYSFDGIDDYINAGSASMLDDMPVFTATAWIKRSSFDHQMLPITKGWGTRFIEIHALGMVDVYIDMTGINKYSRTVYRINDSAWYHIATVYNEDGDGMVKIYINGVEGPYLDKGLGTGTRVSDASEYLRFGGMTSYMFDGLIDDVRIYTSALSGSNIQKLYAEGKASHEVAAK